MSKLKHVRKTKIRLNLPCELTQKEVAERSKELADAVKGVRRAEDNKKVVNEQLNSDINREKSRRDSLANVVSNEAEYREVTVERKYDYNAETVVDTRTDTGEVIDTRVMADDEKQTTFIEEEMEFEEDDSEKEIESITGESDQDDENDTAK